MLKKLFYKGLYGNNSIEFVRGLINVYPFGVIGKQFSGKVKLHAHNNLFQIFVIEQGTTLLQYNGDEYEIEGPTFATVPKNVEHGFHHQTEMKGSIITLSDMVLEHLLQGEGDIIFEMDSIHIAVLDYDNKALVEIHQSMQKCIDEYRDNLPGKQLMLQNIVGQIIVQLYRLPSNVKKIISSSDNTSKVYFRRFIQLIKSSRSFKKMIEEYANDLSISTGHLNRVCQSITGRSPKELIIDFFISEAQIELVNIEQSITEICYSLNFEDPGYFTRLFKKKTGITPKQFREQNHIKG